VTATVTELPGSAPTDDQRAGWVWLAEQIRANPDLLPFMKRRDAGLHARVTKGLRTLAITARSDLWRSGPPHGGRPQQLLPGTPGSFSDRADWLTWLIVGGRGAGKSRGGGEAVRELALGREWHEPPRGALVGQTLDAVRIDMVENHLLQILPPGSVNKWNRGPCELWLANGAYLKGYSSERPDKLRGPNHAFAWCDEIAAWKDADRSPGAIGTTWSNLMLSMRHRDQGTWTPRIVATTTPKPVRLVRNPDQRDPLNPGPGLYDDANTVVAHMSSEDNLPNLAESFRAIIEALRGTRLWDQEVLGRLVDAVLGAQWTYELVQRMTWPAEFPGAGGGGLLRVVVGVDPSIGAGLGDECGIVVAGIAGDGRAYVLEDCSVRAPASTWAPLVAEVFARHRADAVVAEVNQGGELVGEVLGRYAPHLPIREVWAKRGKVLRAEPVALLSDRDRVRLAGQHPELVREMTTWDGSGESPNRLDAMVYAVLDLLPVESGAGGLLTVVRGGSRR
jgi:phage terminase large subunit-like protein